ncbi:solute carrier organic anion transporter family member 1C1-like [Saccostrea echinata]|uniref:solute carrier organic anion transporter family member 1C1-like n=1 Tax=Saccostrea echinata TaxID=191078 RepID=UPI002A80652F|nr:solute carrier organic anion transporter family member 1C1-like [Saccostrea echinata]
MGVMNINENHSTEAEESRDRINPADTACGIGPCRPRFIQCCAHLLPFSFIFGFQTMLTGSLSFYLSSQITTIEKQFDISSTDSGIILAGNDIGFLVSVLFMSYLGHRGHIPRVLSICGILFGLSGLLCSLPHFVFDGRSTLDRSRIITNSSNKDSLCQPKAQNITSNCDVIDPNEHVSQSKWVVLFITLCYVIQGVAKSPRSSLGTVYLDSSSDKTKTGLYLAISTSFGIFGPFFALIMGGLFGKIPVNLKETTMTPEDPRWIGAWWLGFIVFGSLALIPSILVLFFPRTIPEPEVKDKTKRKEEQTPDGKSKKKTEYSLLELIKTFPLVLKRLLKNKVYWLCVAVNSIKLFGIIGVNSFGPKYIENIFNLPSWKANTILGVQTLVTGCLGTFLGGFIVSRLKLTRSKCLKMLLILSGVTAVSQMVSIFLGCKNHTVMTERSTNISNKMCHCNNAEFLGLCSSEGQTFFSPCHAGCTNVTRNVYFDCHAAKGNLSPGICDSGCKFLVPYLIASTIVIISGTMRIIPMYTVLLRSLKEEDRSFGMGLHSFILSLIVFLPAPIVYGKLFDGTCLIWKETCGSKGACQLYDIENMRFTVKSVDSLLAAISFLISIPTFIIARKEKDKEELVHKEKTKEINLQSIESTEEKRLADVKI